VLIAIISTVASDLYFNGEHCQEERFIQDPTEPVEMMRSAIAAKAPGGPEVLHFENIARPTIDSNSVIVKVRASAINRADTLQRKGKYPPPPGESHILGLEAAGTVEEVGENFAGKWKKGDRVMGLLASGGYAEYIKIHGDVLMPIPSHLSFEEGAAIPEVWLTAFQAIYYLGEFDRRTSNRTALIHAGASGVGSAAIQLIKAFSPSNKVIVTTSSQDKIDFCKSLGADFGINYKTENFAEKAQELTNKTGVDFLMDFIGADYWDKNLQALGMDGIMTMQGTMGGAIVEKTNVGTILMKRLQIKGSTLRSRSQDYKVGLTKDFSQFCMSKFDSQELKPVISKVFPWQDIAAAHQFMEDNHNMGKVVIRME